MLKEQEEAERVATEQKASDEPAAKVTAMEKVAPEPTSAEETKALDPVETKKSSDSEAAAVKQAECCIICWFSDPENLCYGVLLGIRFVYRRLVCQ